MEDNSRRITTDEFGNTIYPNIEKPQTPFYFGASSTQNSIMSEIVETREKGYQNIMDEELKRRIIMVLSAPPEKLKDGRKAKRDYFKRAHNLHYCLYQKGENPRYDPLNLEVKELCANIEGLFIQGEELTKEVFHSIISEKRYISNGQYYKSAALDILSRKLIDKYAVLEENKLDIFSIRTKHNELETEIDFLKFLFEVEAKYVRQLPKQQVTRD